MVKADAFAKNMCDVLNPHPVLKFEREHPKKGIYGCVDVVGKDKTGKTRVLIEVELRRDRSARILLFAVAAISRRGLDHSYTLIGRPRTVHLIAMRHI